MKKNETVKWTKESKLFDVSRQMLMAMDYGFGCLPEEGYSEEEIKGFFRGLVDHFVEVISERQTYFTTLKLLGDPQVPVEAIFPKKENKI